MMVRGHSFLGLALALCVTASFAADLPAPAPPTTPSPAQDAPKSVLSADQPVSVSADKAALSENDRVVVLSGNVVVKQGEVQLTADKVTAYYVSGSSPAKGSNITGNIDRLIAAGNVVVTRPGEVVKSAAATYEMAKRQIVMTGHVVAMRGGNIVRGERVVVDLGSQTVKLDMGAPGGRVQGLFVPSSTAKKP
jgi:lipopolysaccharide export system protein LptA